MNQIVTALLNLHGPAVYATITGLVLLEAAALIGLVVPGETALLVGGVLAGRGNLSLAVLLPLVAVAAVAGDSLGYALGRWLGPSVEASRAGRWVGADRWARVHAYVDQRGAWAVILGRWVGVLRALVPAVAGMTRMPYRRFLVANVSGGLVWVALVTALGYLAGGAIASAQATLSRLSLIGAALTVLLAVVTGIELRHHRRTPGPFPDTTLNPSTNPTPNPPRREADPMTRSNWWLPVGICTAATLAAADLLDAAREGGDLAAHDPAVTAAFIAEREPALTALAQATSFLGNTLTVGAFTLLAVAWAVWRRQWHTAALITAAMAASATLTIALKHLVGRSRPPATLALGPADTGYAFPSGHALNATVLFGLLAALALAHAHTALARAGVIAAWLTASTAVGVSRIYLGYHWLTDVLAGWTIGLAVLALAAVAWMALSTRRPVARPAMAG